MKKIKAICYLVMDFLFQPGILQAQFNPQLVSIVNPQEQTNTFRFGDLMNLTVKYQVDSTHTNDQALENLKSYYLLINSIPYPADKSLRSMPSFLNTRDSLDTTRKISFYSIVFQTRVPGSHQDGHADSVLSDFWNQHYKALHKQLDLSVSLISPQVVERDSQSPSAFTLIFYEQWRVWLFLIVFAPLLIFVLWKASMDDFTLLRDDVGCKDSPYKNPFSLSRVQVLLWTFMIFGMIAYLWSVTNFFPRITSAHLVLLGIAAA